MTDSKTIKTIVAIYEVGDSNEIRDQEEDSGNN